MGLFDFFKKKKFEITEEQSKLDLLWDLWVEENADSPYAELMTYQSEINNGGHDQYFLNVGNTSDLQKEMSVLESVLPAELKNNLQKAYKAYLMLDEMKMMKTLKILWSSVTACSMKMRKRLCVYWKSTLKKWNYKVYREKN